jgi:uncharacterized protein (TIGR00255 family)
MRSMTGFGAGSADTPSARLVVEVRGVNQRHLDVRVLGAREFASAEGELRDLVRAAVARGRIDVTVTRLPIASRRRFEVRVRDDLARAYAAALRRLRRSLAMKGTPDVRELLAVPELLEVREKAPDARVELQGVRRALASALVAFDRQRRREGRVLAADMTKRVAAIAAVVRRVERELPGLDRVLAQRLRDRAARLLADVPAEVARLASDLAQQIDRGDVTEELVRLGSHVQGLRAALRSSDPVGRRIEFLLQEVQRELNTTGSKLAAPALTDAILRAKEDVEKLREQVQNVE